MKIKGSFIKRYLSVNLHHCVQNIPTFKCSPLLLWWERILKCPILYGISSDSKTRLNLTDGMAQVGCEDLCIGLRTIRWPVYISCRDDRDLSAEYQMLRDLCGMKCRSLKNKYLFGVQSFLVLAVECYDLAKVVLKEI